MSEWITHRPPTAEDANRFGEVAVALERKPFDGVVIPGENYRVYVWDGVARGARWYPLNKEAADAAEAEQAAIAEQAAAAAEPELTPEPAAEPSPALAGLPKASDKQLWELARAAKEQAMPCSEFPAWDDSYLIQQRYRVAAHRALYQRGDADGYRRCLVEAKATSELNSELARDLTLLQEENAGLKSDLKDLLHSRSCPEMIVIGDLEGELKRRGEWSTPAPEPAVHTTDGFSCGGCSWFVLKAGDVGHCRKHAPAHNGFPPVFVDGWCGDFIDSNDAEPAIH